MKKSLRKLIPTFVMLVITAALVGTSTYAWFSMNTNVTVTGMTVTAKAEGGIVIANAAGADWSNSAIASTASATLYPTSTKDVTFWYHNKSTNANDAKASQAASTYETLDLKKSSSTYGIGYADDGTDGYDGTEAAYYLLNKFTVKSSAENLTDIKFYINSVTVTGMDTSAELDKSLRVAIKIAGDDTTYIYAPVTGATTAYKVGGSDQKITVKTNEKNVETSINAIPTTGVGVEVYAYFEGEDAACKSTNVSGVTLDNLAIEVVFGTATIA